MSFINATAAAEAERWNETRAPQALVVITLCPAIALIVLMMRLYTRTFLLKRVFWEDYIVSGAMVRADRSRGRQLDHCLTRPTMARLDQA